MGRLFAPDSPVVRFLWKFADLVGLNLLWLICCIPVVTIGPSTLAMYCVAREIAKGEWPGIIRTFFKEFKANFKQAFLVSLILLVPIALIAVYLFLAASGSLDHSAWMKTFCYIAALVLGFVCTYIFPLMAHFDNTLGNTLKNSLLLPLANPFVAVLCTALNLLPAILLLVSADVFASMGIFWIVIGGALVAVINSKLLSKIFFQLVPDEDPKEE